MSAKNYDYCCSEDSHGLRYPGFSVVFLQLFSLDYARDFSITPETLKTGFVEHMEKSIDSLIFNMSKDEKKNIRRFRMGYFNFEFSLDEPYPIIFNGKVQVELSLFFGHTVSISYRFVFDGDACKMSVPAATDHIIALLSTHLSAEHWSRNTDQEETDINLEIKDFRISGLHIDKDGNWSAVELSQESFTNDGRVFDEISSRYKKFIKKYCTVFKPKLTPEEKTLYYKRAAGEPEGSYDDFHYAMVDIWENIMHPVEEEGTEVDLFSNKRRERLTEAEIINHIRDWHKPEMIGLMTLYPGEWPYRDPEAYDEVCGGNIAIDTDDLVLVNNNVCVVIGTYGRRGADSPVDWEEHLQERSKYHVSWPEYLLILEMVLAKKHVIGFASDQLIDATLDIGNKSSSELIAHNASLSMRLSRMELQLDVVKYSKFMSHKVMFDRTTARLDLDKDTERLNGMMEVVDNSLHNLSDYKSMKSDFILNFILALISVASTFELFFQNSEMPFLSYFGIENSRFAAIFVWIVATITFFGILLVFVNGIKSVYSKVKMLL